MIFPAFLAFFFEATAVLARVQVALDETQETIRLSGLSSAIANLTYEHSFQRDRFVEDPSLVQEVEESFARTCTCECG